MKKFLLALTYFGLLAWLYWYLTTPQMPTTPVYLSRTGKILAEQPTHEVYTHIKAINDRNSQIKSLYVREIAIRCQQKMTVNVTGELAIEKEKNFRLIVTHRITGQEMDLGSNNDIFWFWSKRVDPPYLHYARHQDLDKTNLRTALNPNWLMEAILGQIDTKDIQIAKFKDFWAVMQDRNTSQGNVSIVTLIDPVRQVIVGRYLYNAQGRMTASVEAQEFITVGNVLLPKKLLIIWYEEGVVMEWDMPNPQLNVHISPSYWQMPNMKNKIDMGK